MIRIYEGDYYEPPALAEEAVAYRSAAELESEIRRLEGEMRAAAREHEFERAAIMRDQVRKLKKTAMELAQPETAT